MSAANAQFQKLLGIVDDGIRAQEPKPPRTEAEEDQMALEWFILEHEGPESLEEYQRNPTKKPLKLRELPPYQRAIIDRARKEQHDYDRPAPGRIYAPRPASEDHEPDIDNTGRCPDGRCKI